MQADTPQTDAECSSPDQLRETWVTQNTPPKLLDSFSSMEPDPAKKENVAKMISRLYMATQKLEKARDSETVVSILESMLKNVLVKEQIRRQLVAFVACTSNLFVRDII